VHKQANVLAALPKSAHPGAIAGMREIFNAEDIDCARVAIKAFEIDYAAKYPKAVAKIVDDAEALVEFYRYPAEHWIHLKTTNPSRPSPPCACVPESPRAPVSALPVWQWLTS
jgi:putative transposase